MEHHDVEATIRRVLNTTDVEHLVTTRNVDTLTAELTAAVEPPDRAASAGRVMARAYDGPGEGWREVPLEHTTSHSDRITAFDAHSGITRYWVRDDEMR